MMKYTKTLIFTFLIMVINRSTSLVLASTPENHVSSSMDIYHPNHQDQQHPNDHDHLNILVARYLMMPQKHMEIQRKISESFQHRHDSFTTTTTIMTNNHNPIPTTRLVSSSSYRNLALSTACQNELNQIIAANITLPGLVNNLNITQQPDVDQYCSTNLPKRTITCNYRNLFNDTIQPYSDACQGAGGVIQTFRVTITVDDIAVGGNPVKVVFENVPSCIGPSCKRDEYIDYVQELLDMESSLILGYSVEFSAGYKKASMLGGVGGGRGEGSGGGVLVLLWMGVVLGASCW